MDDWAKDGVWVGGTVRSKEAHARLLRVRCRDSFDWARVVMVTAADIPGRNVLELVEGDQPVLAEAILRHPEEPIALVAAPDKETLQRALEAIAPETEPLEPVFDVDAALAGRVRIFGDDNVFKCIEITRGDVAGALEAAAVVIEAEYTTGSQEHVYLETQGMQAEWDGHGVTIRGSLQCPYDLARGVSAVLGLPPGRVRVVQAATGGAFGGKEDYATLIAAHAALLARKAGRPVRIVYERIEDMRATTKRHPSRIRHRTGFTRDGRLLALEIDLVLDGGAYATLSPWVLSRAAVHAAGPYRCDNIQITARAVATNRPPCGAFRGFGAPQALFALEAHLDYCATRLGLDPVGLRRKNLIRPGGALATGQRVPDDTRLEEVLDRALAESRFGARREEFAAFNRHGEARMGRDRSRRRGIGLSLFMHGTGLFGNGEMETAAEVALRGHPDGIVRVATAQTEFGQGTRTILAQAAADGLGLPVDGVLPDDPDTSIVPDSGPTVASRTAALVTGLLTSCGRQFRDEVERRAGRPLLDPGEFRDAVARQARAEPLVVRRHYRPPPDRHWDERTYRGDAYVTYAWSCCVVALEVDTLTGEVTVLDVTAVQDVGKVLNPLLAKGQVEGGVAQGLGWALLEDVIWERGVMHNATLTDYMIPTTMDVPPIHVVFLEHPHDRMLHGARGLGELPIEGPAPAVVNALRNALGLHFTRIPVTPERLLPAWEDRGP